MLETVCGERFTRWDQVETIWPWSYGPLVTVAYLGGPPRPPRRPPAAGGCLEPEEPPRRGGWR